MSRVAAGKVPIFERLKHDAEVFVLTSPDARSDTLIPIMFRKIKLDSIFYTDTFRSLAYFYIVIIKSQ
jgi:transposase